MSYTTITVNVLALLLLVFVAWWFFGGKLKPTVTQADVPFTIEIRNGLYQPSLIQIPANRIVTLHFLRRDDGACAATVIFPQLNLSFELPKDQVVTVTLPPQKSGELDFTCRMGMYRGKLVVA